MRASREHRWFAGAVLVTGVLAGSACAGSREEARPPAATEAGSPTTVRPSHTASTAGAPVTSLRWTHDEQLVVSAYERAVQAEVDVTTDGTTSVESLSDTHLDPLLGTIQKAVSDDRAAMRRVEMPAGSRTHVRVDAVRLIDQGTAEVVDCSVDDAKVIDTQRNVVLNDKVSTAKRTARMHLTASGWKVQSRTVDEKWEGEAGCADS